MASEEQRFCENYLLLKPEEATLLNLFVFLLSSGSKKMKFIDCPDDEYEDHYRRNFRHRWLICISILLQKMLLALANQLEKLGNFLERLLNLITSNGSLLRLLLKILLRKNLESSDRSSASYTSVVGNLDTRKDLDSTIKPDSGFKYYGALSIMASKVSYENEAYVQAVVNDHWKMKFLGCYNFWNDFQGRDTTQAIMFQNKSEDPDLIVVAFRGTSPFDAYDWQVDVDFSWYELNGIGKIHGGFMKALGLQNGRGWPKKIHQHSDETKQYAYYTLRKKLKDIMENNEKAKFILTGHSLGGALAILFVAVLVMHEEELLLHKLVGVYTFGQPRVGDDKFGEFMVKNLEKYRINYHRYVYSNDVVPRVPFDDRTFMYKHVGPCLYFNSFYKGKVLREAPNKNYFSAFWVIGKVVNAMWELIRSLIMPLMKGSEYNEGWFLRLIRVVGLVFPGLSAHIPQDYVNATRLGSLRASTRFRTPFFLLTIH